MGNRVEGSIRPEESGEVSLLAKHQKKVTSRLAAMQEKYHAKIYGPNVAFTSFDEEKRQTGELVFVTAGGEVNYFRKDVARSDVQRRKQVLLDFEKPEVPLSLISVFNEASTEITSLPYGNIDASGDASLIDGQEISMNHGKDLDSHYDVVGKKLVLTSGVETIVTVNEEADTITIREDPGDENGFTLPLKINIYAELDEFENSLKKTA